ncbi:MAG TPA: dihydroorotase [Myxococcota bacterium]|nr:dihydroorotase [Myxococcota bacterium]
MATLIKNARIIDPKTRLDMCEDIYIDAHSIEVAPSRVKNSTLIMPGRGLIVAPGFIDLHVHFREPGFTYKEDISSGIKAAWAGGVTSALVMPNTNPALDEPKRIFYQHKRAEKYGFDLMVAAAATKALKGEELNDVGALKKAGAKACTDDGHVIDYSHMEKLLKACRRHNMLCMQHAEDKRQSLNAPLNEGKASKRFFISGQPSCAESAVVARDIELALRIGARYHVLHLSSAESLALVRKAKMNNGLISAEVSPHHLLLCEEDIRGKDASKKMNPPLRSKQDQEALLLGIMDGTIDAVASDHAPHSRREKAQALADAPFGVVGIETSILALLTLVKKKSLPLRRAVALLCEGPARIIGEEGRIGTLFGPNAKKNVCVFDPDFKQVISEKNLHGRSKNSAFIGMEMFGRVMATFQNGQLVYRA